MVKDTNRVEDNAICFAGQVVLHNNKATTTHKLLGTMLKQEVANCFTKAAGLMGQVFNEAATFKVGHDLINWETGKPFLQVNEEGVRETCTSAKRVQAYAQSRMEKELMNKEKTAPMDPTSLWGKFKKFEAAVRKYSEIYYAWVKTKPSGFQPECAYLHVREEAWKAYQSQLALDKAKRKAKTADEAEAAGGSGGSQRGEA